MKKKYKNIILAPHFDDAAYSVSSLFLNGYLKVFETLLFTIFTKSNFAPNIDQTTSKEITAIRQKEEDEFCSKICLEQISLGFKEAPLRGYPINKILQNDFSSIETNLEKRITYSFNNIKLNYQPSFIICPLGIGGHIDHLLVRKCALKVFFDKNIFFFEDLPYAGEITLEEYNNWINKLTNGLKPFILEKYDWLDDKINLLQVYFSQVSPNDIKSVINYTAFINGTRLWYKRKNFLMEKIKRINR